MSAPNKRRVLIIGGGLAGLAAASRLSSHGFRVTLLESRPRLGGRASSIIDRETGESIDNCQHVAMGCCTWFEHFCEQTGCADLFETQSHLNFVGPPNADSNQPPPIVKFAAAPLPAPLHLSTSFFRMPWFTLGEKRHIAFGLRALARDRSTEDVSFQSWLSEHHQPEAVQQRFWHLVLVSALSESLDRISFQHARKVFVDGFLSNRHGWEVSIPKVPLDDIYETRIASRLRASGVEIRLKSGVRSLERSEGKIVAAECRDGSRIGADEFILAVPHWLVCDFLTDTPEEAAIAEQLQQLETAPIASVHLWYDQPITELPHATFVDRLSQWMFNRSQQPQPKSENTRPDSRFQFQVVISAARDISPLSEAEVVAQVDAELKEVWPKSRHVQLLYSRMITEHRAVFSPLPGVDEHRPTQQSPIHNLQVAGDWTQTGWPSTMEGAVRSGYLAAANIIHRANLSPQTPLPDLPESRLFRLLF